MKCAQIETFSIIAIDWQNKFSLFLCFPHDLAFEQFQMYAFLTSFRIRLLRILCTYAAASFVVDEVINQIAKSVSFFCRSCVCILRIDDAFKLEWIHSEFSFSAMCLNARTYTPKYIHAAMSMILVTAIQVRKVTNSLQYAQIRWQNTFLLRNLLSLVTFKWYFLWKQYEK